VSSERDLSRRSAAGTKADQILEQALEHELRAVPPASGDGCVDAETLAAWSEGALDSMAMAATESHLSSCARCQAMAAAFVRSAPDAPTSATTAAAGIRFWRWLVPLAAAAAAVTLWMVVPEQQQTAIAPPSAPQAPADAVAERAKAPLPEAAAPQESRSQTFEPQREAKTAATGTRENVTPSRRDEQQALRDAPAVTAEAPKERQELAGLSSTPAPAALAAPAASPPAALERAARQSVPQLEIVSPTPSSRWRITGSLIERTEDGVNWTPVHQLPGITGGTSPSTSVVWLIGRSGVVLVSTDGAIFARVDVPAQVDLVSITAPDARSATVTAADGRVFQTTDSGRTWR
jgi:hypothetical protein